MKQVFMLGAPLLAVASAVGVADAQAFATGGKLPLTRGATAIEGSAGGGLATWAVIAGDATEDGVGASAFATYVPLTDFEFAAYGLAVGFYDRVEISFAHQTFDTGAAGAALGLGKGFTFEQEIVGLKVRLFGDALYDQDSLLPQVSAGVQYKRAAHADLLSALGADSDEGVDFYLSATKIVLAQSLVLNATARATRGNQFGLLGHGGDRDDDRQIKLEVSAASMITDRWIVGGEYRARPNNLSFAEEESGFDVFSAFAVTDSLTLVGGYAQLGAIAGLEDQDGAYLSVQLGF